jgi:hypothetical protein
MKWRLRMHESHLQYLQRVILYHPTEMERTMTDSILEPMELTGSELDVVAGGGGRCCNPCGKDGISVELEVEVELSICL